MAKSYFQFNKEAFATSIKELSEDYERRFYNQDTPNPPSERVDSGTGSKPVQDSTTLTDKEHAELERRMWEQQD